jgi:hypothetical protein
MITARRRPRRPVRRLCKVLREILLSIVLHPPSIRAQQLFVLVLTYNDSPSCIWVSEKTSYRRSVHKSQPFLYLRRIGASTSGELEASDVRHLAEVAADDLAVLVEHRPLLSLRLAQRENIRFNPPLEEVGRLSAASAPSRHSCPRSLQPSHQRCGLSPSP